MSLILDAEPTVKHEPHLPAYVDSTMMDTMSSCQAKGFWSGVMHLRHGQKSTDLIAGGAYAKGLEVFRRAYYEQEYEFDPAVEAAVLATIVEYGDHELPPDSKKAKTWDRTVTALLSYLREWDPRMDKLKPTGIEFSFAIPLPINHPVTGDPLLYTGRCDMIGERDGIRYVVDDKTTGAFSATWAESWRIRGQFSGYCWAAREYGYDVKGAVVRGTAIQKTQIKHLEIITPRTPSQIERWYTNMLATLRWNMAFHGEALNQWAMGKPIRDVSNVYIKNYGSVCSQYGNCAYLSLCAIDDPEDWLPSYQRYVWNPLGEKPEVADVRYKQYLEVNYA